MADVNKILQGEVMDMRDTEQKLQAEDSLNSEIYDVPAYGGFTSDDIGQPLQDFSEGELMSYTATDTDKYYNNDTDKAKADAAAAPVRDVSKDTGSAGTEGEAGKEAGMAANMGQDEDRDPPGIFAVRRIYNKNASAADQGRLFIQPFNTLDAGQKYTGGSIEFNFSSNLFLNNLLAGRTGKHDADRYETFYQKYKDNMNDRVSLPISQAIFKVMQESENSKDKPGAAREKFIMPSAAFISDIEDIRRNLKNSFIQYQRTRYNMLAMDGVDSKRAREEAFKQLLGSMPELTKNHTRIMSMLQGNEIERRFAAAALSEAWNSAMSEYRMDIDSEINNLTPNQLWKAGEEGVMNAKKEWGRDKDSAIRFMENTDNALGMVFMSAFCPALLLVALLPIVCPLIKDKLDEKSSKNKIALSKKQYTIIDEKAEITSGIMASHNVMKDFIVQTSRGNAESFGQKYINNDYVKRKIIDEKDAYKRALGPFYKKNFEKLITVGTPEHDQFIAEAGQVISMAKEQIKHKKSQLEADVAADLTDASRQIDSTKKEIDSTKRKIDSIKNDLEKNRQNDNQELKQKLNEELNEELNKENKELNKENKELQTAKKIKAKCQDYFESTKVVTARQYQAQIESDSRNDKMSDLKSMIKEGKTEEGTNRYAKVIDAISKHQALKEGEDNKTIIDNIVNLCSNDKNGILNAYKGWSVQDKVEDDDDNTLAKGSASGMTGSQMCAYLRYRCAEEARETQQLRDDDISIPDSINKRLYTEKDGINGKKMQSAIKTDIHMRCMIGSNNIPTTLEEAQQPQRGLDYLSCAYLDACKNTGNSNNGYSFWDLIKNLGQYDDGKLLQFQQLTAAIAMVDSYGTQVEMARTNNSLNTLGGIDLWKMYSDTKASMNSYSAKLGDTECNKFKAQCNDIISAQTDRLNKLYTTDERIAKIEELKVSIAMNDAKGNTKKRDEQIKNLKKANGGLLKDRQSAAANISAAAASIFYIDKAKGNDKFVLDNEDELKSQMDKNAMKIKIAASRDEFLCADTNAIQNDDNMIIEAGNKLNEQGRALMDASLQTILPGMLEGQMRTVVDADNTYGEQSDVIQLVPASDSPDIHQSSQDEAEEFSFEL